MLEKVRMRAGMTREQVGVMGYRPRYAYCVMDLKEPAWTLTSCFASPNGGRYVVVSEIGGNYRCLSIKEGTGLQSFDADCNFRGTRTEVKRMVGNAEPPKRAEAVARGIDICDQ
jgi:site-specific DNA-cytosine methylase